MRSREDQRLTVAIVARNAAATIERALRSALAAPADAILVVDDASDDDTVSRIQGVSDTRLRILRLQVHRTLGAARDFALASIDTPYGMWLDADDELVQGRVDRLRSVLHRDVAHIVADAAELVMSDHARRELPIPRFLARPPGIARLFERNYLPAPGPIAFNTAALRALGYDHALQGAEDIDILLRAIAASYRIGLVPDVGYRIHAQPHSLSRNAPAQRAMYRQSLAKFLDGTVERLWTQAGAGETQTVWALHSIALFKNDVAGAWEHLVRLHDLVGDLHAPLETDGPCSRPEGWRLSFARGTLALLTGRARAAREDFAHAERFASTAEGANNMGVALSRCGEWQRAQACFELALARHPGYADARANLDRNAPPWAITTHPLREQPARADYPRDFLPTH